MPKERGKPGGEPGDAVQCMGASQDAEGKAKELGDPLPDLGHHVSLNSDVFWACTVGTQLTIEKGRLLFPIEYKD